MKIKGNCWSTDGEGVCTGIISVAQNCISLKFAISVKIILAGHMTIPMATMIRGGGGVASLCKVLQQINRSDVNGYFWKGYFTFVCGHK